MVKVVSPMDPPAKPSQKPAKGKYPTVPVGEPSQKAK